MGEEQRRQRQLAVRASERGTLKRWREREGRTDEGAADRDGADVVVEELLEGVRGDLALLHEKDDLLVVEEDGAVAAVKQLDARVEVARRVRDALGGDERDGRRRQLELALRRRDERLRVGVGRGGERRAGGGAVLARRRAGADEDGRAGRRRVVGRVGPAAARLGGRHLDDARDRLVRVLLGLALVAGVLALHDGRVLLGPLVLELLAQERERAAQAHLGRLVVVVVDVGPGAREEDARGDLGGRAVPERVRARRDALEEVPVEEERHGERDDDPLGHDRVADEAGPPRQELVDRRERARRRRRRQVGHGAAYLRRGRRRDDGRQGEVDGAEVEGGDDVDEELGGGLVRGDELEEGRREDRVRRVDLRHVARRRRVVDVTAERRLGREGRDEVERVEDEEGGDEEDLEARGRARRARDDPDQALAQAERARRCVAAVVGRRRLGVGERGRVVEEARQVGRRVGAAEVADHLDAVDLDHDGEDRHEEPDEAQRVPHQDDGRELAELAQAGDAAHGADDEDGDLERVVADDAVARLGHGRAHDVARRDRRREPEPERVGRRHGLAGGAVDGRHRAAALAAGVRAAGTDRRVREDGAREDERLLEADRNYKEREGLAEEDRVDADLEVPRRQEGEHEGDARRRERQGGEPEPERPRVGPQRPRQAVHVEVQRHERRVHEDVGDEHDEDVGRVGLLRAGEEERERERVSEGCAGGRRDGRWTTTTTTHLGETPEAQDEHLGRKERPLDALHLALAVLVGRGRLDDKVLAAAVEEARVALAAALAHFLERDRLGFEGRDAKVAEELGRADERREGERLDGEVERRLGLRLPALALDRVAVLDAVEREGRVGVEELLDLALARGGHGGRDLDDDLPEPQLDGVGGRGLGRRDGRPHAGRGVERDGRVAVGGARAERGIVVVEEEVRVAHDLRGDEGERQRGVLFQRLRTVLLELERCSCAREGRLDRTNKGGRGGAWGGGGSGQPARRRQSPPTRASCCCQSPGAFCNPCSTSSSPRRATTRERRVVRSRSSSSTTRRERAHLDELEVDEGGGAEDGDDGLDGVRGPELGEAEDGPPQRRERRARGRQDHGGGRSAGWGGDEWRRR